MKYETLKLLTATSLYLLLAGNVWPATVYQCVNADNEISFSNQPCGEGETLVKEHEINENTNVIGSGAPAQATDTDTSTETAPAAGTGSTPPAGGTAAPGTTVGGGGRTGGGGGGSSAGGSGAGATGGPAASSTATGSSTADATTPVSPAITNVPEQSVAETQTGESPASTPEAVTPTSTTDSNTGAKAQATSVSTPLASAGVTVISGLTPDPNTSYVVDRIIVNQLKNEITIDGSAFGSGPNIVIYDTFENGVEGELVALKNPKNALCSTKPYLPDLQGEKGPLLGCWDTYPYSDRYLPKYYQDGHSGTMSMHGYRHDYNTNSQLKKYFDNGFTEIFMSYWVRIPPEKTFPGLDSLPGQFPSGSSWKFTWVTNKGLTTTDGVGDICTPTFTGANTFQIAGNDQNIFKIDYNTWWSWTDWMRISIWIRANKDDPLLPGDALFQAVSKDKGFYQQYKSTPIFDADGSFPKEYNQFWIPGWMRPGSDPRTTPLYDDIYIAAGVNSISRVEIGDAPTYSDSTNLITQIPMDWTDSKVKVSVDNAGFSQSINNYYLYITDANGNVNQSGFPLHN